jgi:hypothetical protein
MYFHELKAVIDNGLDWSAGIPENRGKSLFLGTKKNSGKFIYTISPIFYGFDKAKKNWTRLSGFFLKNRKSLKTLENSIFDNP